MFNFSPYCIVDGDFILPNEIDNWNFQHMLLFWFREASQNLSLFRQLFFHSFQGGTKGKMLKNCHNYILVFQHFSFGPPLETMKKKSCLNKLQFWEASRNQKRSIYKRVYKITRNTVLLCALYSVFLSFPPLLALVGRDKS